MKKMIIISLLMILVMASCATKIIDMDIQKTKVSITDMDGYTVTSLLPDSVYAINIIVTDNQGLEYIHPNYRNFELENLNKLNIETQAFFSMRLKTALETFHPAETNAYSFTISVKNNSYPPATYKYPLDWGNYNSIIYSGSNGKSGTDGTPGLSAAGETSETITGSSGDSGTNGKKGSPGKDIKLLVMKYKYGDTEKLLFYEVEKKMLFLTDIKTILFDTSGGNGGQGGSGGNGGHGNSYTDEITEEVTEGINGSPGDGGDGGNGGSGGDITVLSIDSTLFSYLVPVTNGGKGGIAGKSGKSYDTVLNTADRGDRGQAGKDGWDGKTEFEFLNKIDIISLLETIDEEGFEISKVIF